MQVLSQLQETSHHDALLNADDDHGGGGDADHIDHVDDGDLDDPDGNMYRDDNIADFSKPVITMNFKIMVMTIIQTMGIVVMLIIKPMWMVTVSMTMMVTLIKVTILHISANQSS